MIYQLSMCQPPNLLSFLGLSEQIKNVKGNLVRGYQATLCFCHSFVFL